MKRSGWMLAFAGLLGILFFWAIDPRYGIINVWSFSDKPNPIDAAYDATVGTLVGIIGSTIILALGLWLMTRPRT